MDVKPKVEFLTGNQHLIEQYPIVPAASVMPQWFKDMPANKTGLREDSNAKNCPGIVDYLTTGYIVPLWTDYLVRVSADGIMNIQGTWEGSSDFFQDKQTLGMVPGTEITHGAIKLTSPWSVRTPPGWSILCLAPFYSPIKEFNVMPGIVNTDVIHVLNVIMTPNFIDDAVLLKAGTPIYHIIPTPRYNTRADLRKVDVEEWNYLQAAGKGGIFIGDRLVANSHRAAVRKSEKTKRRWSSL